METILNSTELELRSGTGGQNHAADVLFTLGAVRKNYAATGRFRPEAEAEQGPFEGIRPSLR